jgi:hypothetical protein
MSRSRIAALGLLACLCGCAGVAKWDREDGSQFTPYPDGTFRMRTRINVAQPDSPGGEATRMSYLEGWLRDEGLCGAGYGITSRTVSPQGLYSDVVYRGRCKGDSKSSRHVIGPVD